MPRLKRIILHIGTEKTGTTTAQGLLYANRDALLKAGFALTDAFGSPNNRLLAVYGMEAERTDDEMYGRLNIGDLDGRKKLKAELKTAFDREIAALPEHVHTLILSNEHCQSRIKSVDEVRRIYELLSPHADEVRLLVYLRRQIDMAVSAFSSTLRNGLARTPMLESGGGRFTYYDYWSLLQRWNGVFPTNRIDVRLYARDIGGDQLQDFAHAVGVDAVALAPSPGRLGNLETPRAAQSLLHYINQDQRAFETSRFGRSLRIRFLTKLERAAQHIGEKEGHRPSRAEAAAFQQRFEEGNAQICERWFPERKTLFSQDMSRFPEVAPHATHDALTLKEATQFVTGIWKLEVRAALTAEGYARALEGQIKLLQGHRAAAAEKFLRALDIDPHCTLALTSLIEIRIEQGNLTAAERLLSRLERLLESGNAPKPPFSMPLKEAEESFAVLTGNLAAARAAAEREAETA